MNLNTINVCVVGAGAAGLCAIKYFISKPQLFNVTAFELTQSVGGTWNYTEQTGCDQNGIPIHSSMYKNLKTNLPMQIMEFPDFQSNCKESFVHHSKVLQYLTEYAKHFDLFKYIRFEHQVVNICREQDQWKIAVKELKSKRQFAEMFDVLLVCSGRNSIPKIPEYDTLNLFKGTVLHSHYYRDSQPFHGQRVAVVGGGSSGIDICLEVSSVAKQIIFINRGIPFNGLPNNVLQINVDITEFESNSMKTFDNNTDKIDRFEIDTVIFATGYRYNFDFIDHQSCGIHQNPDGTIDGLYKHLINIKNPSMAIMAVMDRILPFPLFDRQMEFFFKTIVGLVKLPTAEAMLKDTEEDIRIRKEMGFKSKNRHMMNKDILVDYLDKLYRGGDLKPIRKSATRLYLDLQTLRREHITTYKSFNYKLISDNEYEKI